MSQRKYVCLSSTEGSIVKKHQIPSVHIKSHDRHRPLPLLRLPKRVFERDRWMYGRGRRLGLRVGHVYRVAEKGLQADR